MHRKADPAPASPGTCLRALRTLAGLLAAVVLASACGGGEGGGGSTVPEPYQWGLRTIGAYQAYARLADAEGSDVQPGKGAAVVGMIDTGIDKEHPLFEGKTIDLVPDTSTEPGDEVSHGTAVASVITGARSPRFADRAHGVAWGADLVVFAIPLGSGVGRPYDPVSLADLARYDADDATVYRQALAWETTGGRRIDFLNLSFGYEGIIDSYLATDLSDRYDQTIAALAQSGRAIDEDKTILVWAAGNAHGDDCSFGPPHCVNGKVVASSVEILPGLVARITELRGHSIAVAALGPDGKIADFSNRCGIAANWCITAPGEDVRVAYFGPHPDTDEPGVRGTAKVRGTSFAAPMVTGGLAVMKHLFRNQMLNTALVERLFATANDRGRYADSTIYGQGVMDLGAATAPVGTTRFALDGKVGGNSRPLQATRLALGGALGDGVARALAGREIAAFDSLGAPFWFDLGDFSSVPDRPSMADRLHDFMAPAPDTPALGAWPFTFLQRPGEVDRAIAGSGPSRLQFGFLATPAGAQGGHLGLAERAATLSLSARDDLAVTAFSTLGIDRLDPALGAAIRWRPTGAKFGLRAGWLAEREAMLGTSAQGAFGGLTAHATFAGIEREADIHGWRVAGGTEFGVVSPSPDGGLVSKLSPLTTSAFALSATRPFDGDSGLRLSITQPLRVETGRATLCVPVGRTKGGDVVRRAVTADLSPTGRQIDIAARWHRRRADGGELRIGAVWTREPGHRVDADPSLSLLAGWRTEF